jgi:hypothetical protein
LKGVIDFGLNKLGLDEQLFVLLAFELIQQVTENLEGVLVLLLFEEQISQVGLDAHTEERALFLHTPIDDVTAKVYHLAEMVLRALVLDSD